MTNDQAQAKEILKEHEVSKPPLAEPYHVAVDRQLKSGHQTYEAAEEAALKIKNRYPQLQVSVFDAKEGRHKPIERSKLASASNNNRRGLPSTGATPPLVEDNPG